MRPSPDRSAAERSRPCTRRRVRRAAIGDELELRVALLPQPSMFGAEPRVVREPAHAVIIELRVVPGNTLTGMAQHDDGWSHGDMLSQAPAAAGRSVPPFGELLREWRERRRLSQLELALQAGTTQRHLSFIERGKSTP